MLDNAYKSQTLFRVGYRDWEFFVLSTTRQNSSNLKSSQCAFANAIKSTTVIELATVYVVLTATVPSPSVIFTIAKFLLHSEGNLMTNICSSPLKGRNLKIYLFGVLLTWTSGFNKSSCSKTSNWLWRIAAIFSRYFMDPLSPFPCITFEILPIKNFAVCWAKTVLSLNPCELYPLHK